MRITGIALAQRAEQNLETKIRLFRHFPLDERRTVFYNNYERIDNFLDNI